MSSLQTILAIPSLELCRQLGTKDASKKVNMEQEEYIEMVFFKVVKERGKIWANEACVPLLAQTTL